MQYGEAFHSAISKQKRSIFTARTQLSYKVSHQKSASGLEATEGGRFGRLLILGYCRFWSPKERTTQIQFLCPNPAAFSPTG